MIWKRLAATLIDFVLFAVIAIPFLELSTGSRIQNGTELHTFGVTFKSWLAYFAWSGIIFAYYLVMETVWAATIGKLVMRLRVIGQDGRPCSFGAVVVRTLMRPVDGIPYLIPYLLGLLVAASTGGSKRLGDIVAGTSVVEEPAVSIVSE